MPKPCLKVALDGHEWQALLNAFSVPERVPLSDVQARQLARGVRFDHSYDGGSLACWTFGTGPWIVLVHGWNSRGAHLLPFVDPLVAAGHSVTLFDVPAHGDSAGPASSVVHAGRALWSLCEALGTVRGLVSHSAGSAASLWAFRRGLRVAASVHVSGPSSFTPTVLGIAAAHGLQGESAQPFVAWVEAFTGEKLSDLDLDALRAGLCHSGLILHAPADRIVPFAASQALHHAWPGSELVPRPGLGHSRILEDHDTVARTVAFLTLARKGRAA